MSFFSGIGLSLAENSDLVMMIYNEFFMGWSEKQEYEKSDEEKESKDNKEDPYLAKLNHLLA